MMNKPDLQRHHHNAINAACIMYPFRSVVQSSCVKSINPISLTRTTLALMPLRFRAAVSLASRSSRSSASTSTSLKKPTSLARGMSNFFFRAGAGLGLAFRSRGIDGWWCLVGEVGEREMSSERGTRPSESLSRGSSSKGSTSFDWAEGLKRGGGSLGGEG